MIIKKIGLFFKLILDIILIFIKSIFISKKDQYVYKEPVVTASANQTSNKPRAIYSGNEMFCKSCHFVDSTKRNMPGSILIEIILWLCFLIPGIIYTLWRHSATKQVCKSCGSKEIIPINSPLAQQILSKSN